MPRSACGSSHRVKHLAAGADRFSAIRTKAMTQGAVPLFTQLWMVPRCTSTSPASR